MFLILLAILGCFLCIALSGFFALLMASNQTPDSWLDGCRNASIAFVVAAFMLFVWAMESAKALPQ